VELKMIDINKSQASTFVIEGNAIYLPFIVVSGLGIEVAKSIIEARNEKKFISRDDFRQRTKINKNHYETLSINHVLDELPESSETSLF
jgi:DNA polymerase-3 subunit alpha (Gram-positive type)